jgi:hypothetical protein
MLLYTCPDRYDGRELSPTEKKFPKVFLAGGISNCPDWQKDLIRLLTVADIAVFNPRRPERFDPNDHETHKKQVQWEFHHLQLADVTSFWFPKETLCPITLFELGAACEREHEGLQKIFVGAHPDYAKLETVKYQLEFYGALHEPVVHSLEELAEQIKRL